VTGAVFTISVKCDKVKGKTDLLKNAQANTIAKGGF
jgi:hypothetical protein